METVESSKEDMGTWIYVRIGGISLVRHTRGVIWQAEVILEFVNGEP